MDVGGWLHVSESSHYLLPWVAQASNLSICNHLQLDGDYWQPAILLVNQAHSVRENVRNAAFCLR